MKNFIYIEIVEKFIDKKTKNHTLKQREYLIKKRMYEKDSFKFKY